MVGGYGRWVVTDGGWLRTDERRLGWVHFHRPKLRTKATPPSTLAAVVDFDTNHRFASTPTTPMQPNPNTSPALMVVPVVSNWVMCVGSESDTHSVTRSPMRYCRDVAVVKVRAGP